MNSSLRMLDRADPTSKNRRVLPGVVPFPADRAESYRSAGYWTGEVLGDLLRDVARADPHRTAVVDRAGRYDYGEMNTWADELAAGLIDTGISSGDRVLVQLPNRVEFLVVCIALFRVGALPVLAMPAHRRAELTYLADYSGAVAMIIADVVQNTDYRELAAQVQVAVPSVRTVLVVGEPGNYRRLSDIHAPARDLPRPDPSNAAFLLLSGGTTGLAKLIPRTHDDYAFQLRTTAAEMGFDEQGVYLAVLPIGHNAAFGCPGVLGALRAGGKVLLCSSAAPDEALPLAGAEGATLTTLMPAFLPLWMETAELFDVDLSGLTIEVGGAMLDPDVARAVRPTLGATLTHWFGMAEGVLCFSRRADPDEIPATSQGMPMCDADELRIVDEEDRDVAPGEIGHLIARGPCTLPGYYAVPDYNAVTFTSDGFLRTGDLARFDDGHRLVVTGRAKTVINRGGEKVSAEEIEGHLAAHPDIRSASVVPVADRGLGEKTCAVITWNDGQILSLGEIRSFLRERGLAEFKLPDSVRVVDRLPMTSVGKVDRRAVLDMVAAPVPEPA